MRNESTQIDPTEEEKVAPAEEVKEETPATEAEAGEAKKDESAE